MFPETSGHVSHCDQQTSNIFPYIHNLSAVKRQYEITLKRTVFKTKETALHVNTPDIKKNANQQLQSELRVWCKI